MLRKMKNSTQQALVRACAAAISCACLVGGLPKKDLLLADKGDSSSTSGTTVSATSESKAPSDTRTLSDAKETSESASEKKVTDAAKAGKKLSTNATVTVDVESNVRKNPSTVDTPIVGVVKNGDRVQVLEAVATTGDPKCNTWCKINFLNESGQIVTGYMAEYFLTLDEGVKLTDPSESETTKTETTETTEPSEPDPEITGDFAEELAAFPESYKPYLQKLHKAHPNWHFRAVNVSRSFEDTVNLESRLGVSLIENSVNDAWKSTVAGAYDWLASEYTPYDGNYWVNASSNLVKYYLDPRNMLTEQSVFQFLNLSFDSKYQTVKTVQGLLNGTFMESATIDSLDGSEQISYAVAFYVAGKESKANPIFLAAKCLQEVSANGSNSTSGDYYSEYYQNHYVGLYNYFNIGASSDKDPVAKGLAFARDGYKDVNGNPIAEKNKNALLPWITPYRSIIGGSRIIAENYINKGQNTIYFMKFNVSPNEKSQYGNHQYMTNIRGAASESKKMYNAYSKAGILDTPMLFSIPVYKNMPESACPLPKEDGNTNAYLKDLSVDGYSLTPQFDSLTCQDYSLVVPASCKSIHINAVPACSKAKVSGIGDVALGESVTTVVIKVTAENGFEKEYTLNVARSTEAFENYFTTTLPNQENFFGGIEPGTTVGETKAMFQVAEGYKITQTNQNGQVRSDSKIVCTGDMIVIKDAEGKTVYIATLFIRGDSNCDGKISAADLTLIARSILGKGTLTAAGMNAGDANKDNKVNAADLTVIARYLLKKGELKQ